MRMTAVLGFLLIPVAYSQTTAIQPIPPAPNRLQASYRAVTSQPPEALVQSTDMIFPHIAMGGGWDTAITIVNITSVSVAFTENFYDESGNPMTVTMQTYPDGNTTTLSSMQTTLAPGGSVKFKLVSTSPDTTQLGWSGIVYNSSTGRLGGYAAFRNTVNGVVNEGLVPLSAYDDNVFLMPFDNSGGYVTGLALVNPGSNLTDHVTITALDLGGNTIASETVTIAPGAHTSYVITDQNHMPSLAGTAGTLIVESDTTLLSGLGIRMNLTGGFAFTSIPIMNFIPGI